MKKIIQRLLLMIMALSTLNCVYQMQIIFKKENEYEQYYTEDTEIKVKIEILENKTDLNYFAYENEEKYQSAYYETLSLIHDLKNQSFVNEIPTTSMLLWSNTDSDIWLTGKDNIEDYKIKEGRFFNENEIEEGKIVALVEEKLAKEKGYKLNETFTLEYPGYNLSKLEIQMIGILEKTTNPILLPIASVKNISDIWLEEFIEKYPNEWKGEYVPAAFLNPTIIVRSEKEYDQLNTYLKEYRHTPNIVFHHVRESNNHKRSIKEFDTSQNKEYFEDSMKLFIVSGIVWVIIETISKTIHKNEEKQFQKKLIEEQEKNAQTIFQMNQEAHQLKHDMKHFLTQLSLLLENDEKDKVHELLIDYQRDINHLEIPAYTQNKTIDLVVNHYMNKAKNEDIDFTFSSTLVSNLKLKDRKLYILLSNALENAFIHNDSRKRVSMNVTYIEPYYRIVIMNTTDFKEKEIDKNHGYGLKSMAQIIEQVQGEILTEKQEDKYIVTLLIPE